MKINRNMSAVIANNKLMRTETRLQKSMERLSSGLKLNSAEDNPAGMAISNKMRAQIDALNQAESNTNDGVSLLQIADGALNEMTSVLQRIRELSVQAASDTNTYEDKKSIQAEIEELKNEIDRIAEDTEYNTKTLLDGSSDTKVYSSVTDANGTQLYTDAVSRMYISDQVNPGVYTVDVAQPAENAKSTLSAVYPVAADGTIAINGINMNITANMSEPEFTAAFREAAEKAGVDVEFNGGTISLESRLYGNEATLDIKVSQSLSGLVTATGENTETDEDGNTIYKNTGKEVKINGLEGDFENVTYTTTGSKVVVKGGSGFKMEFSVSAELNDNSTIDIKVTDIGRMEIKSGANQYQTVGIRIPEMSSESLYIDEVDVTVAGGADRAIQTLDNAISKLSETRSRIGAYQNRLEYATASLAETGENLTSAFSQLTDVDMAKEYTEYASQNILNQAGVSVLSQANELPQQVLSLLS